MPKYQVVIPFAGAFSGEIEAASEEEAIKLAMDDCTRFSMNASENNPDGPMETLEWDSYEHTSEGNCTLLSYPDAEAELVEEESEEADAEI
jgi:hypothetical protein